MKQLLDFVLLFLRPIVTVITPTLKEMLQGFVDSFVEYAKTTPNEFDDILAGFLKGLLE